jgi:hypothetical protein
MALLTVRHIGLSPGTVFRDESEEQKAAGLKNAAAFGEDSGGIAKEADRYNQKDGAKMVVAVG